MNSQQSKWLVGWSTNYWEQRTFWACSKVPNVIYLGVANQLSQQLDADLDEFTELIETGNAAPKWLVDISKNVPLTSPEFALKSLDFYEDPTSNVELDEFDVFDWTDLEEDSVHPAESMQMLLDINRPEPEGKEHLCAGLGYFYLQEDTVASPNIGFKTDSQTDVEAITSAQSTEGFWEALANASEIYYTNGGGELDGWDHSLLGTGGCTDCVPEMSENRDLVEVLIGAIRELTNLQELSESAVAQCDSVVSGFLENFEIVDREDFPKVKLEIETLVQTHPGSLSELEAWISGIE